MYSLVYKNYLIIKPYYPFCLLITIKKSVKNSVMMVIVMDIVMTKNEFKKVFIEL
jgi:hypothetical protein